MQSTHAASPSPSDSWDTCTSSKSSSRTQLDLWQPSSNTATSDSAAMADSSLPEEQELLEADLPPEAVTRLHRARLRAVQAELARLQEAGQARDARLAGLEEEVQQLRCDHQSLAKAAARTLADTLTDHALCVGRRRQLSRGSTGCWRQRHSAAQGPPRMRRRGWRNKRTH